MADLSETAFTGISIRLAGGRGRLQPPTCAAGMRLVVQSRRRRLFGMAPTSSMLDA
jgi:hypothetical protein